MPDAQKKALHRAVRAANQTTNVLLRDFKAFAALKVSNVACPNSFYGSFSLGSTMSLGDLGPPRDPSDPVLAGFSTASNSGLLANETMVRELCNGSPPPVGTPMQEQFRAVRTALLATPFETFERAVRSQISRALAGSNFDPARDIVAITVNRWPHGFAMSRNSLFEPDAEEVPPNRRGTAALRPHHDCELGRLRDRPRADGLRRSLPCSARARAEPLGYCSGSSH